MEIKTIDNKVHDTDKMNDLQSQLVETIEKSGIRQFAVDHKGTCFVYLSSPNATGWTTFHMTDSDALMRVTHAFGQLIQKMTENRWTVGLIPIGVPPSGDGSK